MLRYVMIAALAMMVAAASQPATANEGLVVKTSTHDAQTTMDRFEAIVLKKGLKVFARIDHAEGAKSVGQELPPTEVLIFGSPKLGTPLIQNARSFGLDLPLKVLVWQETDGSARLGYTLPAALAARHDATGVDKVIAKMTKALDAMTSAAAQP